VVEEEEEEGEGWSERAETRASAAAGSWGELCQACGDVWVWNLESEEDVFSEHRGCVGAMMVVV